jgi:hypothetical protein
MWFMNKWYLNKLYGKTYPTLKENIAGDGR